MDRYGPLIWGRTGYGQHPGSRTAARAGTACAVTARAEPDADGSEEHDVVAPGLARSPAGAGPGTGGGSPEPCEPRGLQQPIRGYGTGAPKTFLDNVTPVRNAVMGRENDGRASSNLPPRRVSLPRPCGVTVSTLDSESSDRGSNPREASATVNLATPRLHAERLNAAGAENLHSSLDAVGACPWMTHPVRACGATKAWTHWGLNPGPSACEADVIPLHHVPAGARSGRCAQTRWQ